MAIFDDFCEKSENTQNPTSSRYGKMQYGAPFFTPVGSMTYCGSLPIYQPILGHF
jgi:hypothetical protein